MKKHLLLLAMLLPCLAFSQYRTASTMMSGKKKIVTTQYDNGYVILNSGEKKEGKIQLKVVNNDTVEIRMKYADKSKDKFNRYDVAEFGLAKKSMGEVVSAQKTGMANPDGKELKAKKNAVKNAQPGYIILASGEKLDGTVMLRQRSDGFFQEWKMHYAVFETAEGGAKEYQPQQLKLVSQTIAGEEVIHDVYKSAFTRRLGNGKLIFMNNPFPTTVNKLKTMVGASAAAAVNDQVPEGVEKDGDPVSTDDAYQKEYIIKRGEDAELEIINKKAYKKWATELFNGCPAYSSHPDQKSLLKYGKIVDALTWYNANCGT